MTTVFTIMTVPQLPVRSCLTTWRVFKGDYSIGLTVLPLFLFLFSGVSYVLQKKIRSLFTLYRWFIRLWYELKDLKWWHSFLYQRVHNLVSKRSLQFLFSQSYFSKKPSLCEVSCPKFGLRNVPNHRDRNCLFCKRFWCYDYCPHMNLHQLNCQKRHHYRQQFLVAKDFLNLEYLFGIFLFFLFLPPC